MSEGNLPVITYKRIVDEIIKDEMAKDIKYLQLKDESDHRITNTTFTTLLIKSKEKKHLFLEELKSKLTDTELCILDSTKYKVGKRVGSDLSGYANDLRGVPEIIDERTVFLGNIDLPRADSCKENGILIFDGVSNADEFTQGMIDSLLDTGKLMSYELPKRWSIIVIIDSLDFIWARKILNKTYSYKIE